MSWTAPAMLDALKARLDEWPGLTDVEIFTAPVAKISKTENIVFTRVTGNQEWLAVGGGAREETYTIEGAIHVVRSGSTEAIAKKARDKVGDIFVALADALREITSDREALAQEVGATTFLDLEMVGTELNQGGAVGKNRWAQADFDIKVRTEV